MNDDPYLTFLRARVNKVFYRLPYSGNAGDSLIQLATERILKDLGIRTTVDPRSADVLLVPGGNPTMWPSIGTQRWQALWSRYPLAEFVVGPAGFRNGYSDWPRIVNECGPNVSGLFARDPDSYRCLQAANLRPGIALNLSSDPVLYLRGSDWLHAHRQAATEEYDLAAFRDDHEAYRSRSKVLSSLIASLPSRVQRSVSGMRAGSLRARKIKLATGTNRGAGEPIVQSDVSRERLEVCVETVRAARFVHTDRLHVMLLAAMLGKKVFAYPTSHDKLEGVYRHSLAGWADVTLVSMS
jgi:exopolysaccharide biosynthesis predicted pyruvyltransferase EpsI